MKIAKLHIDNCKQLQNLLDIKIGKKITVIAGENGTGKSRLLGLISNSFSFREKNKIINSFCNYSLEAQFSEVFRFSPEKDKNADFRYSIEFEDGSVKESTSRFSESENRFRIDVGDRSKSGAGKFHKPLIFQGLKRLFPIAQEDEKKIKIAGENKLDATDVALFKSWHNQILVIDDEVKPTHLKTANKDSYAVSNDQYDAFGNSAGQDNIAQLILCLLSFKRLKEDLGNSYIGGTIVIDEIDATLYPAAQINLMKVLRKACKDYNLQVIFTTHSIEIINHIFSEKLNEYKNDAELIFLHRNRGVIEVIQDYANIRGIISELTHTFNEPQKELVKKINVYLEDTEARIFLKNILDKKYFRKINVQKNNLGGDTYISLINEKFPEFDKSIVVLDGDKSANFARNRKPLVALLPGKTRPENVIFNFLNELQTKDTFWSDKPGGYNKSFFLNHKPIDLNDRVKMKDWFNYHLKYWGKNGKTLFDLWKKENSKSVIVFNSKFEKLLSKITK